MDLIQLQRDIKNKELKPFYIFSGEELELQKIYLEKIGKYIRTDSVSDVYVKLTSKMLSSSNNVYVVRDDNEFIKKDKVWTSIDKKIKNGTLIVCYTDINKTTKFYKHFKDDIIEFNHMTTKQLLPTVKRHISGTDNIVKYFIERCNNDYNTILNNIDKFKRLNYKTLTKDICDELIVCKEEYTVFNLIDNILAKNYKNTFKILNQMIEDNANIIGILTILQNKIHDSILVEGYKNSSNIAKDTGLNGWVCKNILQNNKIHGANLLKALRIVKKYHQGILTGEYEQNIALQCCVLEIINL